MKASSEQKSHLSESEQIAVKEKVPVVALSIIWPFILLTSLFAWWGLANNMTDTLLAAFKRIMSFDDGKTAWIQVVCYALGYGCFAIPGAMFIKHFSYKAGVLLGLGLYVIGTLLFLPAQAANSYPDLCYFVYLGAILITFGGLSVLETSCNPFICAIGDPRTAVRRLNLAQSFNPMGSLIGVAMSQIFILSQLNPMGAAERAKLPVAELAQIQKPELAAISMTYASVGGLLLIVWFMILFTRMPKLKEENKKVNVIATWIRLFKNKNYVWSVIAQFFYVGAQIACWSFTVRYAMVALHLDEAAKNPEILRSVEPVSAAFYNLCEMLHLNAFIPKTAEQAGATFYIFSLILFILCRFLCTALMRFFRPSALLALLAGLATVFCVIVAMEPNQWGVYMLCGVSGCMSLMFPTIFGLGTAGLGEDTKMGGAGMVMAICGAALLTQLQGQLSTLLGGKIEIAYFVPAAAFLVIAYYALFVCRKYEGKLRA